jgi:aspartyl-tRNA(Asn)/glutamyl-tRNA(Gln) amidotransferase subunit A
MQYNDLFTVSSNLSGVPAISIPGGLDSQGMPIGIQFIGPHFSEENLLRIGRAYEIVTSNEGWRKQIPGILNR